MNYIPRHLYYSLPLPIDSIDQRQRKKWMDYMQQLSNDRFHNQHHISPSPDLDLLGIVQLSVELGQSALHNFHIRHEHRHAQALRIVRLFHCYNLCL